MHAEYSLLAMFDMYTRICAGLVAIVYTQDSASLKEEERKKKTKDVTICVGDHFRNVCQPR